MMIHPTKWVCACVLVADDCLWRWNKLGSTRVGW
jgi:hypothetical protein